MKGLFSLFSAVFFIREASAPRAHPGLQAHNLMSMNATHMHSLLCIASAILMVSFFVLFVLQLPQTFLAARNSSESFREFSASKDNTRTSGLRNERQDKRVRTCKNDSDKSTS